MPASRRWNAPFWLGAVAAMVLSGAVPMRPASAQSAPPVAAETWTRTGPEIDLALVLAVDISRSMDLEELALQREGYIQALTSPVVLDAIRRGMLGRIAVTYLEWAGVSTRNIVADWHVIDDLASAEAFTAKIRAAPINRERRTSVTSAINFSMERLQAAEFRPLRRVIDISGDGPNNEGGPVTIARNRAVDAGVTINGLPMILKRAWNSAFDMENLDEYYRDCVIGGPGAFMVTVRERDQFIGAIKLKILREVADASISDLSPIPIQSPDADCMAGERQWRQNWERN